MLSFVSVSVDAEIKGFFAFARKAQHRARLNRLELIDWDVICTFILRTMLEVKELLDDLNSFL